MNLQAHGRIKTPLWKRGTGKVVLKGDVRSWAEREEAEKAAWREPGVTQVEDQIRIAV
jgi:osmotically-inducible protein OsmY